MGQDVERADVAGVTSEAARRDPSRDDERRSRPRHGPLAQLLIAWSPLSVILIAYALAGWISAPFGSADGSDVNRLGFALHVHGPAAADRALFGEVPSVWLQDRLVDGSAHWYDAVAALVYATHFVSIPIVTGLAWFRLRDRFQAWLAAVLAFTVVGVGGYVVYPAAPPWLVAEQHLIGGVQRIPNLGWDFLHLSWLGDLIGGAQDGSNPVAAMPSLHAGAALLVTLFLWPRASILCRTTLLVYTVSMAATLVYTGEHFVVDVFAGWLTAGVALTVPAVVRRRPRHRRRAWSRSSACCRLRWFTSQKRRK